MINISLDTSRATAKLQAIKTKLQQPGPILHDAGQSAIEETRNEMASSLATPLPTDTFSVSSTNKQATVSIETSLSIPIERFPLKQTPLGVEVSVESGSRPQLIRGAFGPNVQSLRKGVFVRKGKERLPLKQIRNIYIFSRRSFQGVRDSLRSRLKEASVKRIKESLK